MKKALISPNEAPIKYLARWELNPVQDPKQKYLPIFETYPNSCRVAQVEDEDFPVAPPLFWTDCADNVVADQYYYDTVSKTIKQVVNAPYPDPLEQQ